MERINYNGNQYSIKRDHLIRLKNLQKKINDFGLDKSIYFGNKIDPNKHIVPLILSGKPRANLEDTLEILMRLRNILKGEAFPLTSKSIRETIDLFNKNFKKMRKNRKKKNKEEKNYLMFNNPKEYLKTLNISEINKEINFHKVQINKLNKRKREMNKQHSCI